MLHRRVFAVTHHVAEMCGSDHIRRMARQSTPLPVSDIIASLEALSVFDLHAVTEAAQRLKEEKREAGKQELLRDIRERAEALGLSVDTLLGRSETRPRGRPKPGQARKGATRGPVPAKFRNPETGDTWSGRGRAPRWLTAAEAEARTRDEFAMVDAR